MTIRIEKFGNVLTSRQSGKEAYAAFLPTLGTVGADENIIVDFEGVHSFSPSWGDEFLTPLMERFVGRVTFQNDCNPSVALTLKMLKRINGSL